MASKVAKTSVGSNSKIWTLAQIDKSIASIAKRGKQLRNDAHETLVQIIEHYIAHGDYTRLPALIGAVKGSLGGSISQSIYTWVDQYVTGLKFDENAMKMHKEAHKADPSKPDLLGFVSLPKVDKSIKENVEVTEKVNGKDKKVIYDSAREIPFFTLERNVAQKPFNLLEAFNALLKRAEKALETNNDPDFTGERNAVNQEMVDYLETAKKTLEKKREEVKAARLTSSAPKVQEPAAKPLTEMPTE